MLLLMVSALVALPVKVKLAMLMVEEILLAAEELTVSVPVLPVNAPKERLPLPMLAVPLHRLLPLQLANKVLLPLTRVAPKEIELLFRAAMLPSIVVGPLLWVMPAPKVMESLLFVPRVTLPVLLKVTALVSAELPP